VYHDGRFYSDAAVFCAARTPMRVATFKFQHFVGSDRRVAITDADPEQRVIREIDGLPAAEGYAAAIGVGIGPCNEGSCVSHTQKNLLTFAVVALVVLVAALVALYLQQVLIGGGLMFVAAVLDVISVTKIDKVTAVAFGILAASIAAYVIALIMRNRPERAPDYPPI
jgi:hypothetical protein